MRLLRLSRILLHICDKASYKILVKIAFTLITMVLPITAFWCTDLLFRPVYSIMLAPNINLNIKGIYFAVSRIQLLCTCIHNLHPNTAFYAWKSLPFSRAVLPAKLCQAGTSENSITSLNTTQAMQAILPFYRMEFFALDISSLRYQINPGDI